MNFINDKTLIGAVQRAIEDEVFRAINDAANEAANRVREEVRKRVGEIVVSILSSYSVQRVGTDLVITVKIGDGSK